MIKPSKVYRKRPGRKLRLRKMSKDNNIRLYGCQNILLGNNSSHQVGKMLL